MLSELLRSFIRVHLHHLLGSRESLIEHIHMMLRENTNSKLSMDKSISIKDRDMSNHTFDESRFTSTIWSYQSDSCLHININIDLVKEWNIF